MSEAVNENLKFEIKKSLIIQTPREAVALKQANEGRVQCQCSLSSWNNEPIFKQARKTLYTPTESCIACACGWYVSGQDRAVDRRVRSVSYC